MSDEDRDEGKKPPVPPLEDEDISIEFLDDEGRPFDEAQDSEARSEYEASERKAIVEREPRNDSEEQVSKSRLEDLQDSYLRQRADFENYRKRVNRDREEYRRSAAADVASLMLPVLDNLHRALQVLEKEAPQEWCKGLELVQQQFEEALRKLGMEEIEALGKPFDPSRHEAVMVVSRPDIPDGTVSEVFEKGYTLGGKVVKPARVVVAGKSSDNRHTQGETDA